MLSCDEVVAALADSLEEGAAAAELRREIEEHVARCRHCQVVYDSTHKTLRIVTDAGSFEIPEGLSDRVLKRVREAIRRGDFPPRTGG